MPVKEERVHRKLHTSHITANSRGVTTRYNSLQHAHNINRYLGVIIIIIVNLELGSCLDRRVIVVSSYGVKIMIEVEGAIEEVRL
jgi:hypothetical protein